MDNNNRYEYHIERPNGAEPPKKERGRSMPALIALFLAFTLLVGGAGGVAGYLISNNGVNNGIQDIASPPAPTDSSDNTVNSVEAPRETIKPTVSQPAAVHDGELTIQEIFARGDKSTVAISTTSDSYNVFGQPVSQASAGSGFILTEGGYILTNYHVVEGASDVIVILYDGTEYFAEIVGSDPMTDVAVLKINATGLYPVTIGDSDKLVVGDRVVAIGNPLGELANTLTVGYISAKKRIISIDNTPRVMLQTDASVSPGNSGGPLFNGYGEAVGMVAAKTISSGVEGIGFAIPINLAADIANELIKNGKISGRPLLGITYQDVPSKDYPKGVYVAEVTGGSAADKAGVRKGDVITSLNGEPVASGVELQLVKNLCRVGDTVPMTVWRNGAETKLYVTFDTEMPEETAPQPEQPFNPWRRP